MAKIALITGTSSGVGLASSLTLADAGYTVVATMRDLGRSEPLREAARQAGVEVDIRQLDTTVEESARACVESVVRDHGTVDVLVNNAGAGFVGTLELIPFQHLRDAMEVDFFGTARMTQLVLPLLRAAGGGRVVTVTSVSGAVGTPFNDAYVSAKFATEGLMQSLAPVVARFGISVSVVEPGPIESAFLGNAARPQATGEPADAYADVLAAYRRHITSTFSGAQSSRAVAEVVTRAVTDETPAFRYQTSADARQMVATSLADLTGGAVLAETTAWLNA